MASCAFSLAKSSALADHLEFILGEHLSFAAGLCDVQLREKCVSVRPNPTFFFKDVRPCRVLISRVQ